MKGQQDYEIDIKNNKVKEGFLIKRSRILKQWKQRWMVLTKTHLYSFVQKQVYKKPTQKIPLKQVSTIKSYYKNQYNRPQVIRIESDDADFYLSAKNHQEKWAWMTAIEKMTDMTVCPQEENQDSVNMIRETMRMTAAIRKTVTMKSTGGKEVGDIPKDLFKKLNMMLSSNTSSATVLPTYIEKQQTAFIKKQPQQASQQPKVIQKLVYVPQIKQKIVYVPQIKQVIKQVVKYVQKPTQSNNVQNNTQTCPTTVLQFLQSIMQLKCQNPRPLIQFIVFLIFSQPQKYTQLILKFSTSQRIHHAFSNALLQVLNQQIDQQKLNLYLKFIIILYQNNYEYFYTNDLKLLIEILVREMEMNRSYFNQYLIIGVINSMAGKDWFKEIKHRRQELLAVMNDVRAWTNDPQTKFAVEELLAKL